MALGADPGRERVLCSDLDYDMTKGTVRTAARVWFASLSFTQNCPGTTREGCRNIMVLAPSYLTILLPTRAVSILMV